MRHDIRSRTGSDPHYLHCQFSYYVVGVQIDRLIVEWARDVLYLHLFSSHSKTAVLLVSHWGFPGSRLDYNDSLPGRNRVDSKRMTLVDLVSAVKILAAVVDRSS